MQLIYGERIGRQATLAVVCSAAVFDASGQNLLLTRRADNGEWCIPGGHMEPGESAAEASAREVEEETGLKVRIGRLIGVYGSPHIIAAYPDGNRYQSVVLNFEAEPIGGELCTSDETTEVEFFTFEQIKTMDIPEHQFTRITDAFARLQAAFVR